MDVFDRDGHSGEEKKVVHETRKILHLPRLAVACTAVRVPVFTSHSEVVHVVTRDAVDPDDARRLFEQVPGVIVEDDPAGGVSPLATHAAGTGCVCIGRIRTDPSAPGRKGLAFWVVSDNGRKGAATNAVEIAGEGPGLGAIRARRRRPSPRGSPQIKHRQRRPPR